MASETNTCKELCNMQIHDLHAQIVFASLSVLLINVRGASGFFYKLVIEANVFKRAQYFACSASCMPALKGLQCDFSQEVDDLSSC